MKGDEPRTQCRWGLVIYRIVVFVVVVIVVVVDVFFFFKPAGARIFKGRNQDRAFHSTRDCLPYLPVQPDNSFS